MLEPTSSLRRHVHALATMDTPRPWSRLSAPRSSTQSEHSFVVLQRCRIDNTDLQWLGRGAQKSRMPSSWGATLDCTGRGMAQLYHFIGTSADLRLGLKPRKRSKGSRVPILGAILVTREGAIEQLETLGRLPGPMGWGKGLRKNLRADSRKMVQSRIHLRNRCVSVSQATWTRCQR